MNETLKEHYAAIVDSMSLAERPSRIVQLGDAQAMVVMEDLRTPRLAFYDFHITSQPIYVVMHGMPELSKHNLHNVTSLMLNAVGLLRNKYGKTPSKDLPAIGVAGDLKPLSLSKNGYNDYMCGGDNQVRMYLHQIYMAVHVFNDGHHFVGQLGTFYGHPVEFVKGHDDTRHISILFPLKGGGTVNLVGNFSTFALQGEDNRLIPDKTELLKNLEWVVDGVKKSYHRADLAL